MTDQELRRWAVEKALEYGAVVNAIDLAQQLVDFVNAGQVKQTHPSPLTGTAPTYTTDW